MSYVQSFDELFTREARINDIYMSMADEGADMDALMEEVGELQDRLESRDFTLWTLKLMKLHALLVLWILAWSLTSQNFLVVNVPKFF